MSAAGFGPALRAARERIAGQRPGVLRSLGAAIAVGLTVAVLTYRLLRGTSQD